MKKLITSILLFAITLSLCSCGRVDKNIAFSGESWQTLEAEIYYLEKSYSESDIQNLRDENTPLCVLNNLTEDGEKISELMNEISSLTFIQEVIYFPAPVIGFILMKDMLYVLYIQMDMILLLPTVSFIIL